MPRIQQATETHMAEVVAVVNDARMLAVRRGLQRLGIGRELIEAAEHCLADARG
jgi:GNAT superfamily N-acetyltransferase